jgi:hypothetical protein
MALTDRHELEIVLLRPVDEPGRQRVNSGRIRLVHEGCVLVQVSTG